MSTSLKMLNFPSRTLPDAEILDPSDAEFCLRGHYWEMLHNSSLYSHVYGRVGVFRGLPFYYDGRQLVVIGYSMDQSLCNVPQRMSALITNILTDIGDNLEAIEFWGPVAPLDDTIPSSLHRSWYKRPTSANCDVILPLDSTSSWETLTLRRDVRRAIRNGLRVSLGAEKQITCEHEAVFSTFMQKHQGIDLEEKKYVRCWRTVLDQSDSILLNVYLDDRLTGFVILSLFGTRISTYAYGFFDNAVAGTSDLAHASMIAFCHERGFEFLDLGHSIHANLLRYKRKWGETLQVTPPWCVRWTRTVSGGLPNTRRFERGDPQN